MESPAKRSRVTSEVADGVVVFDVGGHMFKILRQTINKWPSGLLASLVEDIGTDCHSPIFIDANPDRFSYILDWYRHGQIWVPKACPIEAVLQDARFFLLPDRIKINGATYPLTDKTQDDLGDTAEGVHDAIVSAVVSAWPGFGQFVHTVVGEVRSHFRTRVQEQSIEPWHFNDWQCTYAKSLDALASLGCCPKQFTLGIGVGNPRFKWSDPQNVCSFSRLAVLVGELTKRGFTCEVKKRLDVVLEVSIPWRSVRPIQGSVQQVQLVETIDGRLPVTVDRT